MDKEKELKALEVKLNGRRPYYGNSGNVKVSGRMTVTTSEFNLRERKLLRSFIHVDTSAYQQDMKNKLGW